MLANTNTSSPKILSANMQSMDIAETNSHSILKSNNLALLKQNFAFK